MYPKKSRLDEEDLPYHYRRSNTTDQARLLVDWRQPRFSKLPGLAFTWGRVLHPNLACLGKSTRVGLHEDNRMHLSIYKPPNAASRRVLQGCKAVTEGPRPAKIERQSRYDTRVSMACSADPLQETGVASTDLTGERRSGTESTSRLPACWRARNTLAGSSSPAAGRTRGRR